MPKVPHPVRTAGSTALPIALTLVGGFVLRKLFGAAVSVVAMLAVGRLLLTAVKVDLALAERRIARPTETADAS